MEKQREQQRTGQSRVLDAHAVVVRSRHGRSTSETLVNRMRSMVSSTAVRHGGSILTCPNEPPAIRFPLSMTSGGPLYPRSNVASGRPDAGPLAAIATPYLTEARTNIHLLRTETVRTLAWRRCAVQIAGGF